MTSVRFDRRRPADRCRRSALGAVAETLSLLLVIAIAIPSVRASDAAEAPSADDVAFFETEIRPLLVEHCYSCHSVEASKSRGGLKVDTAEALRIGGDLGPGVVPGDLDASLLIEAVRYEDGLQMPPSGKLSARQIASLERWVSMGAPDPRTGDPAAVSASSAVEPEDLWSFEPLANPQPPETADSSWSRSDLDRFILNSLESKGLSPAPPADRRTLIRRATFDLTGLPPTPEEIQNFVDDSDTDEAAFDRVVDRLLASPAYGERWGRHWLDVARYADSNGSDENVAHGNAWRYRDYVVGAFNRDLPYDRFVLEQLAGDLLPAQADEDQSAAHARLIATGFLSLGPKVLAEPDQQKMEMDIIDEQLDTLGQAFLGLTIGCARCHDHKFDPIATADYYALAGILKSTKTMTSFKTVAQWHEYEIPTPEDLECKAEHARTVATKEGEIAEAVALANRRLVEAKEEGFTLPDDPTPLYPAEVAAAIKGLQDELAALKAAAPEVSSAMGVTAGEVTDLAVHIRGNHLTLGAVVPRGVLKTVVGPGVTEFDDASGGRLGLARWIVDEANPLTARVMVNRIWRWHMGRGIVDSTDNFGRLGGTPSHPELLDWLARRFMEDGWSIKAMHRRIMQSSTYRMGSEVDPDALAIDPDARLFWRMQPRRLEAEAIRDFLLAVSGRLDPAFGGSLLTVKNKGYFFDHTSKDLTSYDTARRSLYLPIVRNNLYDVFQLFDAPDASVPMGHRESSTIAPQALFLMNSGLVMDCAELLAKELLGRSDLDDAGRIGVLFERVLGRPAAASDVEWAKTSLARLAERAPRDLEDQGADPISLRSWATFCQVIFASDEFLFIH